MHFAPYIFMRTCFQVITVLQEASIHGFLFISSLVPVQAHNLSCPQIYINIIKNSVECTLPKSCHFTTFLQNADLNFSSDILSHNACIYFFVWVPLYCGQRHYFSSPHCRMMCGVPLGAEDDNNH